MNKSSDWAGQQDSEVFKNAILYNNKNSCSQNKAQNVCQQPGELNVQVDSEG